MQKFIFLSLCSLFLFLAKTSNANESSIKCFENLLTHDQIHLLEQAKKGDFNVTILEKIIDGQKRAVVILGETHFKNKLNYELGRQLSEIFGLRGDEGQMLQNKRIHNILATYDKILLSILKIITLRFKGTNLRNEDASQVIKVDLEKKETPATRGEKFHVFFDLVNVFSVVTFYSTYFSDLLLSENHALNSSLKITELMTLSTLLFTIIRKFTKFEKRYVLHERNEIMVKNILKALSEYPDEPQMLVIVGKNHTGGIASLLQSEGFSIVSNKP